MTKEKILNNLNEKKCFVYTIKFLQILTWILAKILEWIMIPVTMCLSLGIVVTYGIAILVAFGNLLGLLTGNLNIWASLFIFMLIGIVFMLPVYLMNIYVSIIAFLKYWSLDILN